MAQGGPPLGKADQTLEAFFTTKPQSSGMGLTIGKSIIQSQGGRIWADGVDGRGATSLTCPGVTVRP
jgi:signal transduction histidine kinase